MKPDSAKAMVYDYLKDYQETEIERKLIVSSWHELDRFHRLRTLQPGDFQDPLCERGYLAMIRVVTESQTIDMIRTTYFLRATGHHQDAEAADMLTAYEMSEAHKWATDEEFAALLRQVKKLALQRRLSTTLKMLQHYTQRVDVTANQMHSRVVSELEVCFSGYTEQRLAYTVQEGLTLLAEEMALRETEGTTATGRMISLGWRDLAHLVPGASPGQVVVVLARSSMGKSAFTLQLCRQLARRTKTLLVSLEVDVRDICLRLSAQELQRPSKSLKSHEILTVRELADMNMLVDKPKYNSVEAFMRHVRMLKLAHPDLGAVAIDYAQQLARKDPTPQSEASARLKTFALQEGLILIEALQAPNELDKLKDTRPQAGDIRFCKSWEQDADVILALWRPHFYDKGADPAEAWCFVRKNRDGETGETQLYWNGATTSFLDTKNPLSKAEIDRLNAEMANRNAYHIPDMF